MWKKIPGYKNYQINEMGIVRKITIQKPTMGPTGYLRIRLNKGGDNRRRINLHRLVCMAFYGKPKGKLVAMHIDNNKLNNNLTNLKWGTHSENTQQAYDEGRAISPGTGKFGKDSPVHRSIKAIDIKGRVSIYHGIRHCSRVLGIDHKGISTILRKKRNRKTYKGYKFEYI